MTAGVGILGLGVYLPPEIRRNDWWPEAVVAAWMEQRRRPTPPPREPRTEGERRVLAAMRAQAADPFQGVLERHVIASDMSVFDMEERAARAALVDAQLEPRDIDVLLTYTVVPDYQLSNPACILHERLKLPASCFAMHTDAATYAFMMQLQIAEALIATGRAQRALLVQSCAATRLMDATDPGSVLVGDGAAAAVVGRTGGGLGIVAAVNFVDGSVPRTLVASVPGGSWVDAGKVRMHVADPAQMFDVFLRTADVCKESSDAVLAKAGLASRDVDTLCVYQGTPWLRSVVQEYAGLEHARYCDSFSKLGYISAAMTVANLCQARSSGSLATGDLVLVVGGGTGMTYGATLLRWGRA